MDIVYVIIGLLLLVLGGEYLVRASVAISLKLKISRMVVGLTVVSFATSTPELIVSIESALQGYTDIALENVIGSNIANIGLVLGATALLAPLVIDKGFFRFNWPVLMVFSSLLYGALYTSKELSQWEGLGFIVLLVVYLILLIRYSHKIEGQIEEAPSHLETTTSVKVVLWLLIGAAALWGGSKLLVQGAVSFAETIGVSERVIGVTMIAVGTSVPELAASIIAALKKEKAISLGNLIGSNIFNIGSVLGITASISAIPVKSVDLFSDLQWMLAFSFILWPLSMLRPAKVITRANGLFILIAYATFISIVLL